MYRWRTNYIRIMSNTRLSRNFFKKNTSMCISNNEIIGTLSTTKKNGQYGDYIKDFIAKIKCANKVRYIILKKIMNSVFKICKKKNDNDELIKKK